MRFSVFKFETPTPIISLWYDFFFPLCVLSSKLGLCSFFLLELMHVTYAVVMVVVMVLLLLFNKF